MVELFDKTIAECLTGKLLEDAKRELISSLCLVTELPLLERVGDDDIHCTEVYSDSSSSPPYNVSWRGFIGTSDCRDDGMFVYGAHLFPLLDSHRVYLSQMDNNGSTANCSFRYLMLTPEHGWKDLGWQVDEYGEFEHWYREVAE